jgi:NAD(P)-dependent dehydrogenase (short-subunit alcohol dehydrogenase family)
VHKRFADMRGAFQDAFLASDEASYITGIVLPVDGGISL